MTENIHKLACAVLELVETGATFYLHALEECPDGPGRDVFARLLAEKGNQKDRVSAVFERMYPGRSWSLVCGPGEAERLAQEAGGARGIPEWPQSASSLACMSGAGALNLALAAETEAARRLLDLLEGAADPDERAFLDAILDSQRELCAALREEGGVVTSEEEAAEVLAG